MVTKADFKDILTSKEYGSLGTFLAAHVMPQEQHLVKTATPVAAARQSRGYDHTYTITNFYGRSYLLVVAKDRLEKARMPLRKSMLKKIIKELE